MTLFATSNAFAQASITSLKIEPLNRLSVFLKGAPSPFTSELSEDKKKITISLSNSNLASSSTSIHSTGIIQSASIQKSKNGHSITVELNESRGYNCIYLTMSNSIMLEVFDWSKLSKDDEHYRNALLSLENFQYLSAKEDLYKIKLKDNPNAAGILGLILYQEGSIDEAQKYLNYAFDGNSNIADVYAALAQISQNSNNTKQYDYYVNKYATIVGNKNYTIIKPGSLVITNETGKYDSLMYLNSMNSQNGGQTNDSSAIDSSKANEQSKAKPIAKQQQYSLFSDKTILYAAFAIFIVLLMVISTYFKWRKKQIQMLKDLSIAADNFKNLGVVPSNIEEEINNANNAKANAIENEQPIHPALQKYLKNNPPNIKKADKEKKIIKAPLKNDFKQKQKDVLNLAEKILENQKVKKEIETKLENESSKYKKNPNLDLALSLQKKQQNLKSEKISNITEETNEDNTTGLNSSTINAKKKINKLQENKSEIEKLAGKFKQNED